MPERRRPKRRGYVRPSRAKPKTGWTLRELAALSATTVRTIRLYLQRGVLPRPRFMASATRYQRRHLVSLLAIRRLRAAERLTLTAIRTRLQLLSDPDLEAFATEGPLVAPVAAALGLAPASALTTPSHSDEAGEPSPMPRWARVELALGLELHLRDDASPAVHELARRVREMCAPGGSN
jgi:DNA-binding transcriptional MerR regulator